MSKNKILIISGPTATGKTSLAVELAKKLDGELISADSRQIYRGMDIGTGKDHPINIKIFGVDIATPDQSFSVAEFQKLSKKYIEEIWQRNKLPIVVGGTGLYIDSITESTRSETYGIKPIKLLRFILNRLSVRYLQKIYSFLDSQAFKALNNSEKHNPHRLIRKIEIKLSSCYKSKIAIYKPARQVDWLKTENYLHISLTAPNSCLYEKIDLRVEQRIKRGLINEINGLLKKYHWSDPGMNTLGYKEFRPFFLTQNKASIEECIQHWKFDEHAYARRQKTWFNNRPDIRKFDITQSACRKEILEFVTKWYNTA